MFDWLRSVLPHMPHYGYVLVFIVVFLNNLGFPLPGESILLGAGFILGKHAQPLWPPMVAAMAACFIGGIIAFWVGRRLGQSGLDKVRWLHLTAERMAWPKRLFERHGAKTVFLARFVALLPPAVGNVLAGMSEMQWKTFLAYNLAGSIVYPAVYIWVGYLFGSQWKALEAWLGSTTLYLLVAGFALIVLGMVYRHLRRGTRG